MDVDEAPWIKAEIRERRRRKRRQMCIGFSAAGIILLIAGAAVGLYFVISKDTGEVVGDTGNPKVAFNNTPTSPKTTTSTPTPSATPPITENITLTFDGRMRVTSENFTRELNNLNSPRSKNLSDEFCNTMEGVFDADAQDADYRYQQCKVTNFSEGSVIIQFHIEFLTEVVKTDNKTEQEVEIDEQSKQITSAIEDELEDPSTGLDWVVKNVTIESDYEKEEEDSSSSEEDAEEERSVPLSTQEKQVATSPSTTTPSTTPSMMTTKTTRTTTVPTTVTTLSSTQATLSSTTSRATTTTSSTTTEVTTTAFPATTMDDNDEEVTSSFEVSIENCEFLEFNENCGSFYTQCQGVQRNINCDKDMALSLTSTPKVWNKTACSIDRRTAIQPDNDLEEVNGCPLNRQYLFYNCTHNGRLDTFPIPDFEFDFACCLDDQYFNGTHCVNCEDDSCQNDDISDDNSQ